MPSRTPTQVASHAQKHFLRVAGTTKRRSRFASVEESALAPGLGAAQSSGAHPLAPKPARAAASSEPSGSFSTGCGFGPAPTPGSMCWTSGAPVQPPPADSNGVAVGIPVPRPPLTATPSGKLPMLRVLPGRISATMAYTTSASENKPRSPMPHQQRHARQAPARGSNLRPARESQRLRSNGGVAKFYGGGSGSGSKAASASSDLTSAQHSALDALAGVAAALADSAATL